MKTDTLLHPDDTIVLQETDTENSGSIYLYTAPSIRSELTHMNEILENPDVRSNSLLLNLIDKHVEKTMEQVRDFENEKFMTVTIKKPPSPTPPPKMDDIRSFNYFTINALDSVELLFNGRTINIEQSYSELTNIQTIHIPEVIQSREGDRLEMKFNVTYNADDGTVKTDSLEWSIDF